MFVLEILILIALTSRVGKIVEPKGLASGGYKWGAVGLWFGGEIAGGVIGGIIVATTNSDVNCIAYLVALLGAAIGAWVAITIAKDAEPMPGYPKETVPASGEPPQNPQ
jgi:uncharacterized membrane protein